MKIMTKSLMIGGMMFLGACSGNLAGHNGHSGSADGYGQNGSDISSSVIPGSVNDPTSQAYFQQTIGDRVLFEVDQHHLTATARTILDSQAQWLLSNPGYTVVIEGHADEQGTREYNIALGNRRADSAGNYLISRGVADNRVRLVSYGKERPIEVCSQEACYAKNRRAVTVLTGGLGG